MDHVRTVEEMRYQQTLDKLAHQVYKSTATPISYKYSSTIVFAFQTYVDKLNYRASIYAIMYTANELVQYFANCLWCTSSAITIMGQPYRLSVAPPLIHRPTFLIKYEDILQLSYFFIRYIKTYKNGFKKSIVCNTSQDFSQISSTTLERKKLLIAFVM